MSETLDQKITSDDGTEAITWYSDWLKTDRGNPPAFLAERSTEDLGNAKVSKERYVSAEWHAREVDKLWCHVWQMACRENDIPDVGDQLEYTIADQSIIVVRVAPDEIRAFRNACMHRGTPLVAGCKSAKEMRCGFHGWTWNLDGSLKNIPSRWDFPEVTDAEYGLVRCQVATWFGFVFINMDLDAPPFEEHLGSEIPRQLAQLSKHKTWKAVHVGKVINCNWKTGMEAFLEVYHLPVIHPETLFVSGDENSQYDFYGPHARMIFPMGTPSPSLGPDVDPQAVLDEMLGDGEGAFGAGMAQALGRKYEVPQVDEGAGLVDARYKLVDSLREMYEARTGLDLTDISDAEAVDGIQYFVFPNFQPWGGYLYPAVYRWRPNGNDHESCIFEVMLLAIMPDDTPLPRDVPMTMVPGDVRFRDAEGIAGAYGYLLDEDADNLALQQKALHTKKPEYLTFANAQERNIRNFHRHLDSYLES